MQPFSDPYGAPLNWPLSNKDQNERQLRREFGWAIDIVCQHFNNGLERICDEKFLRQRYEDFLNKQDPIYNDLLDGMEDESLAKTFVSYWTIAHTLATQSRFWLETAVANILIQQAIKLGYDQLCVLNQGLLSEGFLKKRVTVADMGEEHFEHLSSHRVWKPVIDADALELIDILVGEQERQRVNERKPFQPRTWTDEQNQQAKDLDTSHLKKIARSFKGQRTSEPNLQCNLLVIEPDKLDGKVHAWAFRFVNPKTLSSHAQRKQERVNLLRLYALLVQEKIMRDPRSIHICVAELLHRYGEFEEYDRYPDYFSPVTYWNSERLWGYFGVPFEVVTLAIRDAAKKFRQQLIDGLRGLLPKKTKPGQDLLF